MLLYRTAINYTFLTTLKADENTFTCLYIIAYRVTLNQWKTGADNYVYPRFRYADEAYFAMITDITSTLEEMGYGWCFAHWYGPYGVAFCLPAIQASTYEQVEDYPYYIDQGMMGLFQNINGIK